MRGARLICLSFGALTLGLLAAARPLEAQAGAAAPAAADSAVLTEQVLTAGRKVFHGQGTCHACHGDQLQGGPIAPSLKGGKWRHIDGSFEAILHTVRGGSPGTLMVAHPGGIDDGQTIQVATYVWAVSQGKIKP